MHSTAIETRTRFQNILFATDFSAAAAHAIPYVKTIAKHYGSSLAAFHVRPPAVNPATNPDYWAAEIEGMIGRDDSADQQVVLYPSNQLRDGARVRTQ